MNSLIWTWPLPFLMDSKQNFILICNNSIKYLNSNGDFIYEIELEKKYENCNWSLNKDNQLCFVDEERKLLIIEKKIHVFNSKTKFL